MKYRKNADRNQVMIDIIKTRIPALPDGRTITPELLDYRFTDYATVKLASKLRLDHIMECYFQGHKFANIAGAYGVTRQFIYAKVKEGVKRIEKENEAKSLTATPTQPQ